MHDAKLPMWYERRDSITNRLKCWKEFYEHSGNKDNIIFPLLIKLGLTHQVVDIVKVLNVRYNIIGFESSRWLDGTLSNVT